MDHDADKGPSNQVLTCANIALLLPRTFRLIFNLFSVYFFEYVIITSFADTMGSKMKALYPDEAESSLVVREYFVFLNVGYQVGVFISRSSLRFVRIPKDRVWILTLLQMLNFVFMFVNAHAMYVTSLYVIAPVCVWVGLMGGASYVNVLHGVMTLETLEASEKEMALTLALVLNSGGIVLASLFSLLLSNTLFKDAQEKA